MNLPPQKRPGAKLPASGCTPFEKDFTRGKQYPKVKTSLKYYHDIFLC